MEQLIALILLILFSLLFDRIGKKRSASPPPQRPVSKSPFPFFEPGIKQSREVEKDEPSITENSINRNEILVKTPDTEGFTNIRKKQREPEAAVETLKCKPNRPFILRSSLKGSEIKKAVVLMEVLNKPRSLNPY